VAEKSAGFFEPEEGARKEEYVINGRSPEEGAVKGIICLQLQTPD